MKIKVDEKEYKALIARVETLEAKVELSQDYATILMERMRGEIEQFFDNKCRVVMVKRDKNEIVSELRRQAIDNIFKEDS